MSASASSDDINELKKLLAKAQATISDLNTKLDQEKTDLKQTTEVLNQKTEALKEKTEECSGLATQRDGLLKTNAQLREDAEKNDQINAKNNADQATMFKELDATIRRMDKELKLKNESPPASSSGAETEALKQEVAAAKAEAASANAVIEHVTEFYTELSTLVDEEDLRPSPSSAPSTPLKPSKRPGDSDVKARIEVSLTPVKPVLGEAGSSAAPKPNIEEIIKTHITRLKTQLKTKESELIKTKDQYAAELKTHTETLAAEKSNHQKLMLTKQTELEELRRIRDEENVRHAEKLRELGDTNERLKNSEKKHKAELVTQNEEHAKNEAELKSTIESLTSTVKKNLSSYGELQTLHHGLMKKSSGLEISLNTVRSESSATKKKDNMTINTLKDQLKTKEETVRTLTDANQKLTDESTVKSRRIAELAATITSIKKPGSPAALHGSPHPLPWGGAPAPSSSESKLDAEVLKVRETALVERERAVLERETKVQVDLLAGNSKLEQSNKQLKMQITAQREVEERRIRTLESEYKKQLEALQIKHAAELRESRDKVNAKFVDTVTAGTSVSESSGDTKNKKEEYLQELRKREEQYQQLSSELEQLKQIQKRHNPATTLALETEKQTLSDTLQETEYNERRLNESNVKLLLLFSRLERLINVKPLDNGAIACLMTEIKQEKTKFEDPEGSKDPSVHKIFKPRLVESRRKLKEGGTSLAPGIGMVSGVEAADDSKLGAEGAETAKLESVGPAKSGLAAMSDPASHASRPEDASAASRIATLEKELKAKIDELNTKTKEAETAREEAETLKRKLEVSEAKVILLEKQLNDKTVEVDRLSNELKIKEENINELMKAPKAEDIERLHTELKRAQDEIVGLKKSLTDVQTAKDIVQIELDASRTMNGGLKKELDIATEKLKVLETGRVVPLEDWKRYQEHLTAERAREDKRRADEAAAAAAAAAEAARRAAEAKARADGERAAEEAKRKAEEEAKKRREDEERARAAAPPPAPLDAIARYKRHYGLARR